MTVAGITSAVSVAASQWHSCALIDDGTVKCWGMNLHGQLGDGTQVDTSMPVKVSGLGGAVSLAVGNDHTCAVMADGSAQCWGMNSAGELGIGPHTTIISISAPRTVLELSGALTLVAGGDRTYARMDDGTVVYWGRHLERGAVGRQPPEAIADVAGATVITAGQDHACALLPDAVIKCWGSNRHG